jgi:hypothetical protein
MKLKKLLEGMSWERKPGQPLPTLKDTTKAHSLKEANDDGGFDYEYYEKQLEAVQETIEEFEYEFHQTLDGIAESDEVYGLVRDKAEQAVNASRRYINGAAKQLEGIAKLIDRAKTNNDWTA